MKLSHDYRLINSSFDTSFDFSRPLAESFHEGSEEFDAAFWVGHFEYTVIFKRKFTSDDYMGGKDPEDSNDYEVMFKISDSKFSSDEEMIQVMSKLMGRPMKDATQARMHLGYLDKYGLTNLGQSRPILSGVINAIKQFTSKAKPSCLIFDAYEPKRREFYSFLVNRLSRTMGFQHSSREKVESQEFTVCMK
jgi:hypothetical protein